MEYSIQQVTAATGVTGRTLRHYDAIGLLPARRLPGSGYRIYDRDDLVRLQRILLLRELGVGLTDIARILDGQTDHAAALRSHLAFLDTERERITRQIASVQRTIEAMEKEQMMSTEDMFDGFDHTRYREEVERRWGEQAYADSDRWWRGLGADGQWGFLEESKAIAAAWQQAREAGVAPDSERAQQIAARHAQWIAQAWAGQQPSPEALIGLAQMYVADERFAANYGGVRGASYVCEALTAYAHSL